MDRWELNWPTPELYRRRNELLLGSKVIAVALVTVGLALMLLAPRLGLSGYWASCANLIYTVALVAVVFRYVREFWYWITDPGWDEVGE